MFEKFIFPLTLLALAGCSSIPPYKEPQSEASAKLRMRIVQPVGSVEYLFLAASLDPATCQLSSFIDVLAGRNQPDSHRVGMVDSKAPQDGIIERLVPPDREFSVVPSMLLPQVNAAQVLFAFNSATQAEVMKMQSAACLIPIFTPQVGKQYELVFRPSPEKCEVSLFNLEKLANGEVRKTDITHEQNRKVLYKYAQPLSCNR